MLKLLTPRIVAASAGRHRQLELDEATFARSANLFVKALQGAKQLTRPAMFALLRDVNISTAGQRGNHILQRMAHDGLICFGPREGKQQTFVLLDEWVPESKSLEREGALAELAKRYFTGHGPATVQDLVWWPGLKVADAKGGVEMASAQLGTETVDVNVYYFGIGADQPETEQPAYIASRESQVAGRKSRLSAGKREPETEQPAYMGMRDGAELADAGDDVHTMPGFDEFIVGYRDRSAAIDPLDVQKIQAATNGMFSPTVVVDGRVAGTWKRTFKKDFVAIAVSPFAAMSKREKEGVVRAAERYGKFLGLQIELVISTR